MIKRPVSIKKGDVIGITAPSFGAATEPYSTMIDVSLDKIKERGYKILEGKTARLGDGIGISTDPKVAASELMEFYKRDDINAIISAGGGELMNETITHVDFIELGKYPPKWFMGYSDNTNFIFPLVTMSGVMGIYGPCISGFAKKWEGTEEDSFALLEGTKTSFSGYEKVAFETDDDNESEPPKADFYYDWTYEYNAEKELVIYSCENGKANKLSKDAEVSFEGILLGGCLDVLANLVGTRFDNMKTFNEKNQDVIWVLEACDLTPMSYRRALWNLREAGWFANAKGFIIGRPRTSFGQNMMGVDQYNAVTEILKDFNVPIIMDADIGHIDPMLPVVMGANAKVSTRNNNLFVDYLSL